METTYRVLIVEDIPTDAELTEREIKQVLTPCVFERVETEEDFLKALDKSKPDIIISDYKMPAFDGMTALKLTLERTPLTPFIIVTGSINEETAVGCMKSGATNYVIKQHIKRLGPAVLHALEEKKIRMERSAAWEALKESEEKYRNVVERANDGIAIIQDEIVKYVNTHLAEIWGGKVEELIGTVFSNYVDSEALPDLIDKYKRRITGENIAPIYETVLRRKDGSKIYAEINAGVITFQGKPADLVIVRDITERKLVEEKLKEMHMQQKAILDNIPDLAWLKDKESRFIAVNESVGQACGASPEDLVGKSDLDIWPRELAEKYRADDKYVMETLKRKRGEEPFVGKDGNQIWIETIRTPVYNNRREIIGTTGIARDITERKKAEEALLTEKSFTNSVINSLPGMFYLFDEDGRFLRWNRNLEIVSGYSFEEIEKMTPLDFFSGEDKKLVGEAIQKVFVKGESNVEANLVSKDGRRILYYFTGLRFISHNRPYLVGMGIDITERRRAEDAQKLEKAYFEQLFESAPEAIVIGDVEGRIVHVNAEFNRLFAYTQEEASGRLIDELIVPESLRGEALSITDRVAKGERIRLETTRQNKDRIQFNVSLLCQPIVMDGKLIGVYGIYRDITKRKKAEERIEYLAYYDALTGLPNRNLFLDRLEQGIARAEPASKIAAVLIMDIDRFKSVNDAYGTEAGDRVLNDVAQRLSTAVRKGDTVARLGNDEFGIALLDIADIDDVTPVFEKIMKYISCPVKVSNEEIALSFSTGISIYPHDSQKPQDLLKSAGLALASAKKEGRKTYQFYNEDMNIRTREFISMERDLLKALTDTEFVLHYQPYWDINTRRMLGMEALIRWQNKDQGLVSPGKFIPVLEETGMIKEVGEWILREAMRQVKEWQDNDYPVVPVSVNLSLVQFRQRDLAEIVQRIMGECGYYPSLLTLEITESAFMQDVEFTYSVLKKLKDIGISISIDDFGTGYSSLAYLKRFPISNLKIDISFIRDMVKDPDSASIVMAIINMAHTLQLKTIAEGIETEEQWKFLRLLRCDMGQGFYLSKPLPAEEIEKLLKHQ